VSSREVQAAFEAELGSEVRPMPRHYVESREYKLLLRCPLFGGNQPSVMETAARFWSDVARVTAPLILDSSDDECQIDSQRVVRFFDTRQQRLNAANFILRIRNKVADDDEELTLKFRHPDRYVAEAQHVEPKTPYDVHAKFEEDVKAPFLSLFSASATATVPVDTRFRRVADILAVFPYLERLRSNSDPDDTLDVVNDFTAREIVLALGKIQLRRTPRADAACALIIWYKDGVTSEPVAVEFSFRYKDQKEEYSAAMSARAFNVFHAVQRQLKYWVDSKAQTKTQIVYGKRDAD
jgi:hypothetical protein